MLTWISLGVAVIVYTLVRWFTPPVNPHNFFWEWLCYNIRTAAITFVVITSVVNIATANQILIFSIIVAFVVPFFGINDVDRTIYLNSLKRRSKGFFSRR